MTATDFELLASYWTIAGDVCPFAVNEASPLDFRARVVAAAGAGYHGIGLNHDDLVAVLARHGVAETRTILADHGIRHLELEFLIDWFADGDRRRAADVVQKGLLDGAAELGVHHVKVGGDFGGGAWPMDRMVEQFHRLCEDGAAAGAPIALEIMPWTNLCTIDMVLQVVQGAGHRNGGLVLDIWHFARGGIAYGDIARIPPQLISFVESGRRRRRGASGGHPAGGHHPPPPAVRRRRPRRAGLPTLHPGDGLSWALRRRDHRRRTA